MFSVCASRVPLALLSATTFSKGIMIPRKLQRIPHSTFHVQAFPRASIPISTSPSGNDRKIVNDPLASQKELFFTKLVAIVDNCLKTGKYQQLASCKFSGAYYFQPLFLDAAWSGILGEIKAKKGKFEFHNLHFSDESWLSFVNGAVAEKVENLSFDRLFFPAKESPGEKIAMLFPKIVSSKKTDSQKLKTLAVTNSLLNDEDATIIAKFFDSQAVAIEKGKYPLMHLDLSRNHIGWRGLKALGDSKCRLNCKNKVPHIVLNGNKIPSAEITGSTKIPGFKETHAAAFPWFKIDYTNGDD